MLSVKDAAEYILWLTHEKEEQITNLKLQKLLYYAQGHHLARHFVPLFDAAIHSWQHGPVIPEVYQMFKKYGTRSIPSPTKIMAHRYSEIEKETMQYVFNLYGKFSAWTLRAMTHDEPLWQNTKEGEVIKEAQIREYFLTKKDVEPKIVYAERSTWDEIADDLLEEHRSLWEKLARV